MAIEKPPEVRDWLKKLNITVLGLEFNLGDWLELVIDRVIEFINNVFFWAEQAWNKAVDAWNKAVEIGKELRVTIFSEIQKVLDIIGTWDDALAEWWEVRKGEVGDWIDIAKGSLTDWVIGIGSSLNKLTAWWLAFRTDILPTLINLNWFYEWMGAKLASIWEWWETELVKIRENIELSIRPVRDEVNRHTAWLDLIKDFIDDPSQFLYNRLEDFFDRFW